MLMKCFILIGAFLFSSYSFAIPYEGSEILVVGPSLPAVNIGQEIAKKGGNVIDVAVATGLALTVTSPYFSSLGAGGFALIHMNGKVEVLDFREKAPQATHAKFYVEHKDSKASLRGGAAIGVPGFPAGLVEMHKKFGKLSWAQVIEPAIQLANKGFQLSGEWVSTTKDVEEKLDKNGKKYFFKNSQAYKPGEILKQPQLAQALLALKKIKAQGFYQGAVAQDIVSTVKKAGGVLSLQDLKNYQVRWLKPLVTDFNGYKIYLMPPPSSGGVVIAQALKLIELKNLKEMKALSVEEFHSLAEIENRSFRGRTLLGDPDFNKNPLEFLLSEKYLKEMAASIQDKHTELEAFSEEKFQESKQTTHFNVMDKKGNAVALTVTLNHDYGSGVVTEKYGISLNNEMDDFTTKPGVPNAFGLTQGMGNKVEPGKRPLSSMSPTLVEKGGKIIMALGAPGGPRIITGVLQTLYRVLMQGWDVDQAIQAPRVHDQFLPKKLFVDEKRFSPDVIAALQEKGHTVEEGWMASVRALRIKSDGLLEGATDSRTEGYIVGY